jgi:hypothetical protein
MSLAQKKQWKSPDEIYQLWWQNQKTGRRLYAGRAYYHESYGDYSIHLHMFDSTQKKDLFDSYYLRPKQCCEEGIFFEVQKAIYKEGRVFRLQMGSAFQSHLNKAEIEIDLFYGNGHQLILTEKQKLKGAQA